MEEEYYSQRGEFVYNRQELGQLAEIRSVATERPNGPKNETATQAVTADFLVHREKI